MGDTYILIKDPSGVPLKVWDQFTALDIALSTGGVGQVAFPSLDTADLRYALSPDCQIEVWRSIAGRAVSLLGDKIFLARTFTRTVNAQGVATMRVDGPDLNEILMRRVVAYYAGTAQTEKSQAADDLLKAVVSENFGAGATDYNSGTGRSVASSLAVQANQTLAPTVYAAFPHREALAVLQENAQASYSKGTYLTFDIVSLAPPSGISVEFRTYTGQRGVDRRLPNGSNPVLLDVREGVLSDVQLVKDYRDTRNYVYAGGEGGEFVRPVSPAQDSVAAALSPFARREEFIDGGNTLDTSVLTDAAGARIREKRAKRLFVAKFTETPTIRFGIEVGLGDYCSAQLDGEWLDVRLDAFALHQEAGDTRLSVALRSDT